MDYVVINQFFVDLFIIIVLSLFTIHFISQEKIFGLIVIGVIGYLFFQDFHYENRSIKTEISLTDRVSRVEKKSTNQYVFHTNDYGRISVWAKEGIPLGETNFKIRYGYHQYYKFFELLLVRSYEITPSSKKWSLLILE